MTTSETASRDAFIQAYCERLGKNWKDLQLVRACVRCHCEEGGCEGWAMVPYSGVEDYEPCYYHEGDPPPYPRTAREDERIVVQ